MERKLVKQGRNALTVTLPAKWLRSKDLDAGDCVYIDEKDDALAISSLKMSKKREVILDVKGFDNSMIYHLVFGKYIEGYDSITLVHNNPSLVQELGRSLLGMIIEEHSTSKTVYKSIVSVPEDNIKAVLRRATFMFLQQANTLVAVSENKATVEDVKNEERLLDENLRYCLRYINKYESNINAYKYLLLCSTIESAGDIVSSISRNIGGKRELAKNIHKHIQEYVNYIFADDFKKLYLSLRQFKNNIKKKTFADGLAYSLAEMLYNDIGYLVKDKKIG